jgi:hypothetical protein
MRLLPMSLYVPDFLCQVGLSYSRWRRFNEGAQSVLTDYSEVDQRHLLSTQSTLRRSRIDGPHFLLCTFFEVPPLLVPSSQTINRPHLFF